MENNKFNLVKVDDFKEWDDFVDESPQGTIFSKYSFLKFSKTNFSLFWIKKGFQNKAGIVLILDEQNNCILNEFIIYGGCLLFANDTTQKHVKGRAERFEITEFFINEIDKTYKNIYLSLPPDFEDMRPFLWHNYHSENKKDKFSLDLKYTSILDISELLKDKEDEKYELFKNMDTIRQRNIRKSISCGAKTFEENNVELFMHFYNHLMISKKKTVSSHSLLELHSLVTGLLDEQSAFMYLTKDEKNKTIYIVVMGIDKKRAYYLWGAGNPESTEHYRGTISFWNSFKLLAKTHNVKRIDMEGVNSPQRGWFKLAFGGDLKTYYKVYKDKQNEI